jgi:DNA-binding response OmpR family regulator
MPRPVCLICEDEMLIAIDVAMYLEGIGVAVAGPFTSGADALAWAAANRADFAVLDYALRDGECLPLIRALQEQKVPIIIHSGWPANHPDMPPAISGLPWVSKPMDRKRLLKVLAETAPHIIFRESLNGASATLPWGDGRRPQGMAGPGNN